MIKTRDVIASIESRVKNYENCSDLYSCPWISIYVISDTSILNCTKQYVLDYGLYCNITYTTITCSCNINCMYSYIHMYFNLSFVY